MFASPPMPAQIWRNTLSFLPLNEVITARLVCKTFKIEAESIIHEVEELEINRKPETDLPFLKVYKCVALHSWAPFFPCLKTLVIGDYFYTLEAVLECFSCIESLTIALCDVYHVPPEYLCNVPGDEQVYPKLKKLSVNWFTSEPNCSLPSLESLHMKGRSQFWQQWSRSSVLPKLKTFKGNVEWSILPLTLECIEGTINLSVYDRLSRPTFRFLTRLHDFQVSTGNIKVFGYFLRDHGMTIEKLGLNFDSTNFSDAELHALLDSLPKRLKELKLRFIFNSLGLILLKTVRDHFQENYTVKINLEGECLSEEIPLFFQHFPTQTVDLHLKDDESPLKTTWIQPQQFVSLVVSSRIKSASLLFPSGSYPFPDQAWNETMCSESHEITFQVLKMCKKITVKQI